jgi:hypothetical protein
MFGRWRWHNMRLYGWQILACIFGSSRTRELIAHRLANAWFKLAPQAVPIMRFNFGYTDFVSPRLAWWFDGLFSDRDSSWFGAGLRWIPERILIPHRSAILRHRKPRRHFPSFDRLRSCCLVNLLTSTRCRRLHLVFCWRLNKLNGGVLPSCQRSRRVGRTGWRSAC